MGWRQAYRVLLWERRDSGSGERVWGVTRVPECVCMVVPDEINI